MAAEKRCPGKSVQNLSVESSWEQNEGVQKPWPPEVGGSTRPHLSNAVALIGSWQEYIKSVAGNALFKDRERVVGR